VYSSVPGGPGGSGGSDNLMTLAIHHHKNNKQFLNAISLHLNILMPQNRL
jgi:hypothetical protein